MDPPADEGGGAGRLIALALVLGACARPTSAPAVPEVPVPAAPPAVPTEAGRYLVRLASGAPGELVLVVTTPAGEPVTDAEVAVVLDGEAMIVQPGERGGGAYLTRAPAGWAPKVDASERAHVAVDAGAGLDRAVLPLPP